MFYRATMVNGQHVFADCENVPLSSPLLHMCVCCPYVTYIDLERHDCTCVRVAPWPWMKYELECVQSYDNQQLTRIYNYNLFLQCTVFE